MAAHDLVLRNGTVIDGTGGPRRVADVAVTDGVVTHVGGPDGSGRVEGVGAREVDCDGLLVTPGFVDVHTHYDGQATWDTRLQPSSWHGVTTVVMGNCGVGFAPVHDHDHERLIQLMEGVEDIPGAALAEGLRWGWTGFDGFLDALDTPHDMDLAAQVPHAALRLHVMGERGADHTERATDAEIAEMGRLAADGIAAGALGFTTSRTRNHRTSTGDYTPTLTAERAELVGIAEAIGVGGQGVLQMVGDFLDVDAEFGTLVEMMAVSGRPLSFSLAQSPLAPDQHRELLKRLEAAVDDGHRMRAQVAPRAVGLLLGLDATLNPFLANPVWQAEVAGRPLAEQAARMADPDVRARILGAHADARAKGKLGGSLIGAFDNMYPLTDPPDYEPDPATSIGAVARARGVEPAELAYDHMLGDGGRDLFYVPFLNYADGNLDATREMLAHPLTVPGLSDGGAHVGTICDGSFPTFLLTHWGRDRTRGELFDLEYLVSQHTRATAEVVGLLDRGVLAPGMRADVNVIDFDALAAHRPEMHHDLPAGGRRVLQRATGYRHTFVAGVETYADGEATGELPGRLVRGAQPAPA